MAVAKKDKTTQVGYGAAVITDNIGNYANDPFVLKKNEEAKKHLKNIKFPSIKK